MTTDFTKDKENRESNNDAEFVSDSGERGHKGSLIVISLFACMFFIGFAFFGGYIYSEYKATSAPKSAEALDQELTSIDKELEYLSSQIRYLEGLEERSFELPALRRKWVKLSEERRQAFHDWVESMEIAGKRCYSVLREDKTWTTCLDSTRDERIVGLSEKNKMSKKGYHCDKLYRSNDWLCIEN